MAIITISRGSLSGGRTLAECLADHLGIPALADEILQEAATRLGASEEAVRGGMETPPGLWERLKREREKYVLAVQTVLSEACLRGSLVYHGLAGQFLLRGMPGVLRVRLIAPLEMRIRTLLERNRDMTRTEAAEYIRNVDGERKRRVSLLFDADVENPAFYDLTVSLRTFSTEAACAVVAEAASQPEYEASTEVQALQKAFAERCQQHLQAYLTTA